MGKKKITKQEKPVAVEAKTNKPDRAQKVQKKSKTSVNQQILSPELFARLESFQTFYRQVLQLKSKANNTDVNSQISSVNDKVRQQIQSRSSEILRNELVSLQEWIKNEQVRLQGDIETVRKCLEENQRSLQSTGAFSAEQISAQLRPIEQKIQERQITHDNYGNLLGRARDIYGGQQGQQDQGQDAQKVEDNVEHDIDLE